VGVAFYPQTSSNMHALIKLADIAMYQAKQNKVSAPEDYLIFANQSRFDNGDMD
jgi:GGDEF domain-containing protein